MIDVFTALVFKRVISAFRENGVFLLSTLICSVHDSGLVLEADVVYE